MLIALLILFSSLAPSFLTANNLAILAKHVAISAILAIGMTFVVLTGGIDLSVGSVAGLSGMVAGYLLTQGIYLNGVAHFPPVVLLILITLLVCLGIGILNGWLVAKAGVAPFIATLGTLYIARGAALLLSNGKTFPNLAGQVARRNTRLYATRPECIPGTAVTGLDHAGTLRHCLGSRSQDAVGPSYLRGGRQ